MWTTSSSRADTAALVLLIAAGCASAPAPPGAASAAAVSTAPLAAPDAPQPAIVEVERRPPDAQPKYARIELTSARVRRIDEQLARLAGPELMRSARDLVAVEAMTTSELPPPVGAASPVLIINGQTYPDTWFVKPNRLVAFVERASLRESNTAEAMWLGGEAATRSRKPVTFKPAIE